MKPYCSKCRKKVEDVTVRDDICSLGGVEITIKCHGEVESFILDSPSVQSRFQKGGLMLDPCFRS